MKANQFFVPYYKTALFDVDFGNFNMQKDHEDEVFLQENILRLVLKCTEYCTYVKSLMADVRALTTFNVSWTMNAIRSSDK